MDETADQPPTKKRTTQSHGLPCCGSCKAEWQESSEKSIRESAQAKEPTVVSRSFPC